MRDRFLELVFRNPVVAEVVERAERLDLPGWYLTSGCLFQTVWNLLDGHEPTRGILDHDLFYFDDRDLSWEAEDRVIRRAATAFDGCGGEVEVRNEARVHLWYEEKFGVPCPPHASTESAIDCFAATACAVAVRTVGGEPVVYAPFGFDDLFAFVLRPNRRLAPRSVYEAKAARWKELWPRLTVLDWDS
jgi:uncharacterized protein